MSILGKIESAIVGDPAPKETSLAPVVRGHYRGGADEPCHLEETGARRAEVDLQPDETARSRQQLLGAQGPG